MKRSSRLIFLVILLHGWGAPLAGEEGVLVLHVTDTQGRPLEGILISPGGDSQSAPTDKMGRTRIRLARGTRPGSLLSLVILPRKGRPTWAFIDPWHARVLVPSFRNDSEAYVPIVLAPATERAMLENGSILLKAIDEFNERSRILALSKGGQITEDQRQAVREEIAAPLDIKGTDIDRAAEEFASRRNDPRARGSGALYMRDYPTAEKELEEALREDEVALVSTAKLLGQSYFENGKYREAAKTYELAAKQREDTELLSDVGLCWLKAGEYGISLEWLQRALEAGQRDQGPESLAVAQVLGRMATLYLIQGNYSDAESLLGRALKIQQTALGPESLEVATTLGDLGYLNAAWGRYEIAKGYYSGAMKIREKVNGPKDPDLARSMADYATVLYELGEYGEAISLLSRAIGIDEEKNGPFHPQLAEKLSNLAAAYEALGDHGKSEPLYVRALEISERALGPYHVSVAVRLNNLAELYDTLKRYSEAEGMYLRALSIDEMALGCEHPDVATIVSNLGALYHAMGYRDRALEFSWRALNIYESVLGYEHPYVAMALNNVASLEEEEGNFNEADALYLEAVEIAGRALPAGHPLIIQLDEARRNLRMKLERKKEEGSR